MSLDTSWSEMEALEFVSLSAAGQDYCIDITRIREIRRMSSVTPLPMAESAVLGVMNLRGAVIPIYDLSEKLGMGTTQDNERNVVIVVAIGLRVVGLLVEAVSEIVSVSGGEIRPNPTLKKGTGNNYIDGLVPLNEKMIRVLNIESILSNLIEDVA